MAKVFLRARWEHLILATYAVDDDLLAPHLPPGLELDRYEGRACASFVAFRFLDTRVWGVRWPWHVNFCEVNLRFYVREPDGRRGVVFVRELVPHATTATIARVCYNEPYAVAGIDGRVSSDASGVRVSYSIRRAGRHEIEVEASPEARTPGEASAEHFFKEHEWGYGRTRSGRLLRYRVEHPVWRAWDVRRTSVRVDWGRLYGPAWAGLREQEPMSVVLAEGSEVTVWSPEVV